MMKAKKLAVVILTMLMVLTAALPVLAEETAKATIQVGMDDTRSYAVYQIFTGDLSGTVLSNVKWGKNGTGTEGTAVDATILDALAFVNSKADTEKLAVIQQYVDLESEALGTVSKDSPMEVLPGYYLFVDLGTVGEGEAYSLYVVEIVDSVTIAPKRSEVVSEKKVKDTDDTAGTVTDWQDSADYDIGDDVPFQLKGTVPEDYASYETYYYAFHDEESTGLTFNEDSVVVKVDGAEIEEGYTVKTPGTEKGCTFEIVFEDLKAIASVKAGSVITVEYTSELNEDAVLGSLGNPNTMYLEYSNNPNTEGTGKTTEDTVIVFTYQVVVNKVDKDENALPGAGFTLYKKKDSGEYVAVGEELTGEALTTFVWSGLDDGDYKLSETTTPEGYNTIADIEFTISAEHTNDADETPLALIALNGGDTFTGSVETGALTGDIVNNAGTTLPETGGIGTTVFYIIGGILVLAAIVLLVTRKRMNANQ